ncbi:structural cement protein Gp24 [Sphingomonas sp.]|uniref:structural cement protein Gp24 n=1 Tax=Sphingomonas sp. TaxID=28214 RepID=UPI003BAA94ED
MPVLQTTYSDTVAAGYPGMVANGETSNRITRTCEVSGGIAFGAAAFRGSGDHGCTNVVGTAATFLGPVIATSAQAIVAGGDADEYAQYDNVNIMTQGAIWVLCGDAVTDGAPVYVDAATGEWTDTSTDNIAATDWIFDTTGAADTLVKIVKR